jgi:hypothetical protein
LTGPSKATQARRRFGAALFLGVFALAAQAQEIVSWKTFAQVELTRAENRIAPRFSEALAALDQKEVKVQGFMLPLDVGEKHALFILSAVPPTCAFCMPGGPEAVVEVRAKRPLAYTDDAVTVSGKLSVLKNDPTGIFYRLTDAMPVK